MWQVKTLVFTVMCLGGCIVTASKFEKSLQEQEELLANYTSRSSQWDCNSDADCTVVNSSCINDYCSCESGYIFNMDMTACLRAATAYGDECEETLQCTNYLLTGASCTENVCICGAGYHYIHGRCFLSSGLFEECTADVNCYVNADIEATSCVNGTCVCSDGFYQREYRTCRRAAYAVGDECTIDNDCLFDEDAYCTNNRVCAIPGQEETTTQQTVTDTDIHQPRNDNATGPYLGSDCTNSTDCSGIANARCGSFGTCICNRAYFASNDLTKCIAELGEDCDDDDEIFMRNSFCRNGSWSCGLATVFSTNNQICRKTTKQYNWSCLHDEQCYIFGSDSSCQNKRCLCNEGSHWVQSELFCWVNKAIGESCYADEDCYVEGLDTTLTCRNSVCSCPDGFHSNPNGTACRDDVAVLGGSCDYDNDCTVTNSVCLNEVCTCDNDYYELNGECAAGINATCTENNECAPDNSVCSSGLCSCVNDYVNHGIESCVPVVHYGDECEFDVQCSAAEANTACDNSTSTCTCTADYHYRFSACREMRVLGESCTSAGECYTVSDLDRVSCLRGICACNWDYVQTNTTYCQRSGAITIVISTWLGLASFVLRVFFI